MNAVVHIFCWSVLTMGMFIVAAVFEVAGTPEHQKNARLAGWLVLLAVVCGAYLLGAAR